MARIYPVYDLPADVQAILERHLRDPKAKCTHVAEALYEEGQALLRDVFPDSVIVSECQNGVYTGFHYAIICRK